MKVSFKLIILAIAIIFVTSELSIRLYYFFTDRKVGTVFSNIVTKDNYYILSPNKTFTQPERYGDIIYSINRDGFRDTNHDHLSKNNRILLLGDSITFGTSVDQGSIYANQLEKKINTLSHIKYEIINESIFGYGGREELNVLKDIGLKYNPQIIILQFYMNDFFDCLPKEVSMKNTFIALKNIILNKSISYIKLRQLWDGFTYILVHDIRRKYFGNTLDDQEPRNVKKFLLTNKINEEIEAFKLINLIRSEALNKGIKFIILITPHEIQLYKRDYDIINERFASFCSKYDIDFCDPLLKMRNDPQKTKLFIDGLHFSKYGHQFITEFLFNKLQNGYL